jgi:hypothetical protein
MKIRIGFVSNSSSSSFLIYGTRVSSDMLEQVPDPNGESGDFLECRYEAIEALIKKAFPGDTRPRIGYYNDGDCGFYIGASWCSVKDDETGKQFKDVVQEEVSKVMGDIPVKCETYDEVIYS